MNASSVLSCMGVIPNNEQSQQLKNLLKITNLYKMVILGLPTQQYNCWAWAIDDVGNEQSPNKDGVDADLEMATEFLANPKNSINYTRIPKSQRSLADAIVYGLGNESMVSHIAIRLDVQYQNQSKNEVKLGKVWTSKLADSFLITHLPVQVKSIYGGHEIGFFRRNTARIWSTPPFPPF